MTDQIDWDKVKDISYYQVADLVLGGVVDAALIGLKALPSVDKKIRPIFETAARNVARDHPDDLRKLVNIAGQNLKSLTDKFLAKKITNEAELENFIKHEISKDDVGDH